MWKIKRPENEVEEIELSETLEADDQSAEVVSLHPRISEREEALLQIRMGIHQGLLDRINLSMLDKLSEEQIKSEVTQIVPELLVTYDQPLNREERANLIDEVMDELLGLGPLEPLLKDESITDILVNGCETVFVERGGTLQRVPTRFQDEKHLMRIIQKIVSAVGRRIDESSPFVDARLKDGSRVNAIVAPLALDGSLLSIRKFAKVPISMKKLVDLGSVPEAMAEVLQAIVSSRRNVLISGGTGSGKTTMLNALSSFIDPRERIVTIEDSAELQLQQEHVARLETRPPNIEGRGEVSQRDLVKNALRMRPDRIIVGEVRGGEALDMLQAMNTGHDGSLTTAHSNSPRDTLHRIETMTLMAGMELPLRAVREQISAAFDLVVHLARLSDGTRRVTQVSEVQGLEGDVIVMQDIFRFEQTGIESGKVIGYHTALGIPPKFIDKLRNSSIDISPDTFAPTVPQRQQQKRGGWH